MDLERNHIVESMISFTKICGSKYDICEVIYINAFVSEYKCLIKKNIRMEHVCCRKKLSTISR